MASPGWSIEAAAQGLVSLQNKVPQREACGVVGWRHDVQQLQRQRLVSGPGVTTIVETTSGIWDFPFMRVYVKLPNSDWGSR